MISNLQQSIPKGTHVIVKEENIKMTTNIRQSSVFKLFYSLRHPMAARLMTCYQTWQLLMRSLMSFTPSIEESFRARPSSTGRLPASCDTGVARFLAHTCVKGWKKESKSINVTYKTIKRTWHTLHTALNLVWWQGSGFPLCPSFPSMHPFLSPCTQNH